MRPPSAAVASSCGCRASFAPATESIMAGGTVHPIVVLTSSRSPTSYGSRLIACQARGFIPKDDLSAASLQALTG